MESDRNPIEVDLFPRLNKVGRFIKRLVSQLPEVPFARGDSYIHPLDVEPEPVVDWPDVELGQE